ncbi:hypothetical protein B0H63DRAFT_403646 [Podospora didyma]|uniref:Amine oxidase domain-containing protein n=1 Tax=Podospora didyma TaxID=330526 RepID=A0AAE0K210_9PEZI|nr:hypothetical protein B0H63DRAFT_403646 [Podospora didyma]
MISILLTAILAIPAAQAKINRLHFAPGDVITRDVVIIGGGAAGSHAAVRLKQNHGKSVVVVERESNLGGHVNTHIDEETGQIHDYGVQVYFPFEDAMDFFKQVNVTTYVNPGFGNNVNKFVDFTTGQALPDFKAVDAGLGIGAIKKYYDLTIAKGYDKMTEPGYWGLPAGKDIPADLLLPIGEFVKKYDIEPMLQMMYPSTGGDVASRGNFAQVMTLTFMKDFPTAWAKAYLGEVPMYRVEGGNQRLYDKIAALLGSDVLYDSLIEESHRSDSGVEVVVINKKGERKLVVARQLLVAVPPSRENLLPFDRNIRESSHFQKAKYGRSHTGIIANTKLPKDTTLRNMPSAAVQHPLYPFLKLPFVLSFSHYGSTSKLFSLGVSGENYTAFEVEEAQATAQRSLEIISKAGTIPPLDGEPLKVVAWSDHGVGGFGVSPEDMRNGWMTEMNNLQGYRSTWYTGGALAADFTTTVWKFNDQVLARMVKAVR